MGNLCRHRYCEHSGDWIDIHQFTIDRGALSSDFTELLYGYRDLHIHQQATERKKDLVRAVKAIKAIFHNGICKRKS